MKGGIIFSLILKRLINVDSISIFFSIGCLSSFKNWINWGISFNEFNIGKDDGVGFPENKKIEDKIFSTSSLFDIFLELLENHNF